MKLENIRKELDIIDAKLIKLLAKRQAYMPFVGKYKKENNLPFNQPEREKEILKSKGKMAKDLGLDPNFVEKVFLLIFKNSKEIQKRQSISE